MMTETHLTRVEAAKYLRVSPRTLARLLAEGKLPHARVTDGPRGKIIVRRQDLDAWVRRRVVDTCRR